MEQWLLKQKEFCLNCICIQMGDINSRAFLSEHARSGACVLGVLPPSIPKRAARMKNEASE